MAGRQMFKKADYRGRRTLLSIRDEGEYLKNDRAARWLDRVEKKKPKAKPKNGS